MKKNLEKLHLELITDSQDCKNMVNKNVKEVNSIMFSINQINLVSKTLRRII